MQSEKMWSGVVNRSVARVMPGVILAALGGMVAMPAHALLSAECQSVYGHSQYTGFINTGSCSDVVALPPGGPREASAEAWSYMGGLHARSSISFLSSDGYSNTQAVAEWREDGVVINSSDAALQGTRGRFYFSFDANGTLGTTESGSAQVFLSGSYTNSFETRPLYYMNEWQTPTSSGYEGPLAGENYIQFVFGEPFDFIFRLGTITGSVANAPGDGSAFVDYYQSAYWGGISEVVDAFDNPVSAYTVATGSGVNLAVAAAVPEPEVAWMFGMGLLTLLAGRRLRQSA